MSRHTSLTTILLCVLLFSGHSAQADLIRLKNGGELRGQIVSQPGTTDSATVTVETLAGAVVSVEKEQISFLTRRSPNVEEYETRAKHVSRTADGHWELAEWCRELGLKEQRDEQLELLLEVDPEHEEAHRALGHSLRDGQWMTRDELMAAQGYIKYKGRYITQQELDLIEKSDAVLEAEREWFQKVRLWFGWMTGRHSERRLVGLAELRGIRDPHAVPALVRTLQEDKNPEVRRVFVHILSQMGGLRPVEPLVRQSLYDVDRSIRSDALEAISSSQYKAAVPLYEAELKADLNITVRRAAAALVRFAEEDSIPALIDALATTHRYRIRVPDDSQTLSFRTDGTFGNGGAALPPEIEAGLLAGQFPNGVIINQLGAPQFRPMKTITIKYEHTNPEARAALKKLTNEDFGYDERTWKLWWTSKQNAPAG